jgi:hypothetical protein
MNNDIIDRNFEKITALRDVFAGTLPPPTRKLNIVFI